MLPYPACNLHTPTRTILYEQNNNAPRSVRTTTHSTPTCAYIRYPLAWSLNDYIHIPHRRRLGNENGPPSRSSDCRPGVSGQRCSCVGQPRHDNLPLVAGHIHATQSDPDAQGRAQHSAIQRFGKLGAHEYPIDLLAFTFETIPKWSFVCVKAVTRK